MMASSPGYGWAARALDPPRELTAACAVGPPPSMTWSTTVAPGMVTLSRAPSAAALAW